MSTDANRLRKHDLLRTEARIDAHIQDASAQIVMVDRRVGAVGERVDLVDRRCDAQSERLDSQFRRVDTQFQLVNQRLDAILQQLTPDPPDSRAKRRWWPSKRRPKHRRRAT